MKTTQEVLDHHLKCFGEGDLAGVLSDYAKDAVLFTADGPLKGVDAIRPLFEAMFADFAKPGASFAMQQLAVEGEIGQALCEPIRGHEAVAEARDEARHHFGLAFESGSAGGRVRRHPFQRDC